MMVRVATRIGPAAVVLLAAVWPVYQMIVVSLLPQRAILDSGLLPDVGQWTLDYYRRMLESGVISASIYINSVIVGLATMLIGTTISAMAGYALSRYRFPGSSVVDRFVLLGYIIPPILLVVPIYVTMVGWGLHDTLPGLVLAHTVLTIPFGIWMLRGFFAGIPLELDEAARVDGASRVQILLRIALPLSLPGLAAVAVFSFMESWSEFLFASVLLSTKANYTFPVGLYAVAGTYGDVRWGETMAAATIGAVPIFVLFLLFQRWLVAGLTSGAVKG
jgi:ABC-type glycerol-3-phosphate transport system permease component